MKTFPPRFQLSSSVSRRTVAVLLLMIFGALLLAESVFPQDRSREILGEGFTRNRPKGNQKRAQRPKVYRLASGPPTVGNTTFSSNGQIGLTVWHLRPAAPTERGARILLWNADRQEHIAERASTDTPLQRGAKVRLSIESARNGYLYVINRSLYSNGLAGPASMIFPALRLRNPDNKMRPGRLIDIPDQQDRPNYLDSRNVARNQTGELLILLVTAKPLDFEIGDTHTDVPLSLLSTWEKRWGGGAQKFEMVGGAGQEWTNEEKEAAGSGRRLREDEPSPQTLYRLPDGKDDGLLVTVTLKYAPAVRRRR